MSSWRREVEQEFALHPDDEALLEHVLGDDRPPQGLHQGGYKPFGEPTDDEDREFWDWRYPPERDE